MPINTKKFLHASSFPSLIAGAQLGLLSHHPSSMEHRISSFPGREDHRGRGDRRAAQSEGLLPTNQAAWSLTILLRGPREHLLSPHFYHHLRILKAGARTQCVHNNLSICQYDPVKIRGLSLFPEEHGFYHCRILKRERMKVREHISGPVITCCMHCGNGTMGGQGMCQFSPKDKSKTPSGQTPGTVTADSLKEEGACWTILKQ